jgi:hypothetical protein
MTLDQLHDALRKLAIGPADLVSVTCVNGRSHFGVPRVRKGCSISNTIIQSVASRLNRWQSIRALWSRLSGGVMLDRPQPPSHAAARQRRRR